MLKIIYDHIWKKIITLNTNSPFSKNRDQKCNFSQFFPVLVFLHYVLFTNEIFIQDNKVIIFTTILENKEKNKNPDFKHYVRFIKITRK